MRSIPKISLVVPAYNEEGNIDRIYGAIKISIPNKISYEIIFVDDGSVDNTLDRIKKLSRKDKTVKYISFSRNFGQQYALKAGIDHAKGDAIITMDADLEHPPKIISEMIKKWQKGAKIVITKRIESQEISFIRRLTSRMFYKVINYLSDVKISENSPDFRLLDRSVASIIKASQESALFLRGLVMWSGGKVEVITYHQHSRKWGRSKYNLRKMMALAVDAITSFSTLPLRLATILGFLMSFFTGIYGLYALAAYFTNWHVITGWPSVIISVLFIGGLQLIILGIIGEYIGKIFIETKKRPLYIVSDSNV